MADQVAFAGLTFGGPASPYGLAEVPEGWAETAEVSFEAVPSTRHGVTESPPKQGARFVTAKGRFRRGFDRDQLLRDLRTALPVQSPNDRTTKDLAVTFAGETLHADAQVRYAGIDPDRRAWYAGVPGWKVVWRCPDPSKYGAWVWSSVVSLEPTATGLIPPLGGLPKALPAKPIGGEVTVVNPGTDPQGSPVVVLMTGSQPYNVGVTSATTGHRVAFDFSLAVGDSLRLESELGAAWFNGAARWSLGPSLIEDLAAVPGSNTWRATGVSGSGASVQVGVRPRYSW